VPGAARLGPADRGAVPGGHRRLGRGHRYPDRHLGGRGGGRRRDLVPVVAAGGGPLDLGDDPPGPAPRGIAAGPAVSYTVSCIRGGSRWRRGSSTLVSGPSAGFPAVSTRGSRMRAVRTLRSPSRFSRPAVLGQHGREPGG